MLYLLMNNTENAIYKYIHVFGTNQNYKRSFSGKARLLRAIIKLNKNNLLNGIERSGPMLVYFVHHLGSADTILNRIYVLALCITT